MKKIFKAVNQDAASGWTAVAFLWFLEGTVYPYFVQAPIYTDVCTFMIVQSTSTVISLTPLIVLRTRMSSFLARHVLRRRRMPHP